MSLQISEVNSKEEFAEVVKVEFLAYEKPYNAFWEILKGPSIEENTDRNWASHLNTQDDHWLQVKKGDQVVGAAEWIIHEKNPFEDPQPIPEATWWPEGHLKSMADHMLNTFFSGRPSVMNRPHLLLSICFVHPDYRRQGVGRLLLEWGCKIADEKRLESFVESTDDGRDFYKAHGFVIVRDFFLDPEPSEENEDSKWFELKKKIAPKPYRVGLMWRPVGGEFVEGMKFPWAV